MSISTSPLIKDDRNNGLSYYILKPTTCRLSFSIEIKRLGLSTVSLAMNFKTQISMSLLKTMTKRPRHYWVTHYSLVLLRFYLSLLECKGLSLNLTDLLTYEVKCLLSLQSIQYNFILPKNDQIQNERFQYTHSFLGKVMD